MTLRDKIENYNPNTIYKLFINCIYYKNKLAADYILENYLTFAPMYSVELYISVFYKTDIFNPGHRNMFITKKLIKQLLKSYDTTKIEDIK
jgi:hypothetical protein